MIGNSPIIRSKEDADQTVIQPSDDPYTDIKTFIIDVDP